MKVPTDIPLDDWIRSLIKEGTIYKFYKTDEWLELRAGVMRDQHYECQRCLEHGIYTRADMVHHVNEVRKEPRLALSRTFIDKEGNEQRNLIALCNDCHEIVHDRLKEWQKKNNPKFENEERW